MSYVSLQEDNSWTDRGGVACIFASGKPLIPEDQQQEYPLKSPEERDAQELSEMREHSRQLGKENKLLKTKIRGLESEVRIFKRSNKKLREENESLKADLKQANERLWKAEMKTFIDEIDAFTEENNSDDKEMSDEEIQKGQDRLNRAWVLNPRE